jgi:hypothetical protein
MKSIIAVGVCLLFHYCGTIGTLSAQNTRVPWASMDMGSGRSSGGNSSIFSAVGQPFAGISRSGNIRIVSGFMGYPRIPGLTSVPEDGSSVIPAAFRLFQNYPNPFNPSTTIHYELPKAGIVRLSIFNQLGEEVARLVDGPQEAGYQTVRWNAEGAPTGIYWYNLRADGMNAIRKMALIK